MANIKISTITLPNDEAVTSKLEEWTNRGGYNLSNYFIQIVAGHAVHGAYTIFYDSRLDRFD